jgi:putative ABC transport system ATP-binding protein
MIKIRELCVAYKGRELALDHLNLDIEQGERVAIMGGSGCGKSTLLAVLGGMLRQTSGEYEFRGRSLQSLSPAQLASFRGEQIGFVFQNFALLPHLTLLENLFVPMEHLKFDRNDVERRALDLLTRVGIENLADRFPSEVSGGQAQRTAIARSLMRKPPIILADEPTGSLDEQSADEVLGLLNSLSEDGTTVLVVTHSERVAQGLRRTVHMAKGMTIDSPEHVCLTA